VADRDSLQRQTASHLLELDRLRQEKESLEMQQRVAERDLIDLRDKVTISNRSLVSATDNIVSHETSICQLRGIFITQPEKVFWCYKYRVICKSLRNIRNRLCNSQDRHSRKELWSTCKVGQKIGMSLPLLTCSPSVWPSQLVYRRGQKSRRDLWITLYFILQPLSCFCFIHIIFKNILSYFV
jgi:hypothetical protein